MLAAVSGVAGSGKSSLILGCLPQAYPETIIVDQNPARGSRRSNAAANAVDAALFPANSKGACPDCNGLGVIYTDLAHLGRCFHPDEACDRGGEFLLLMVNVLTWTRCPLRVLRVLLSPPRGLANIRYGLCTKRACMNPKRTTTGPGGRQR